jgi:lipid A ethanolaminephosphotransferase
VSEALTINEATINQVESLSSPADEPSALRSLRGGEGVVLVVHVGESIRADRMSLNGYERDTTPWLCSQKNLINFPTCISAACDTCQAEIALLTNARRDIHEKRPEMLPSTGSVLDLFTANGFEMYSFFGRRCAQKLKYDRVVLVLTRRSRQKFNAPGSPWTSVPQMQEVLQNTPAGQNLLFFVNNEGSHTPFEHYDRQNTPFAPAASHFQNPAAQAVEVNNAYDSSIHYTDEYFRRVAELLGNRPFVYLYVSDHGEYLGHDGMWGRAALGEKHINYHATDGCKVGMFVLYNEAFEKLNPQFAAKLGQLRQNAQLTVAHEHFFHTLLGLFSLETKYYNPALDLTSPQAQPYDGPKP